MSFLKNVVLSGTLFDRLDVKQVTNLAKRLFFATVLQSTERLVLEWSLNFQRLCGEAIHQNQSLTKGTISCYIAWDGIRRFLLGWAFMLNRKGGRTGYETSPRMKSGKWRLPFFDRVRFLHSSFQVPYQTRRYKMMTDLLFQLTKRRKPKWEIMKIPSLFPPTRWLLSILTYQRIPPSLGIGS